MSGYLLSLLYFVLPIIVALLPSSLCQLIAIIVSVSLLLFFFSLFILGVLGSERIKGKRGFPDMLEEQGFKKTLIWMFEASFAVILNYGVVYTALQRLWPSIHFKVSNPTVGIVDFEYFSFVTIITLGYGDILPISWLAKLVCMSEMAFGIIIFFVALSLVVGGSYGSKCDEKTRHGPS